MALIKCTECGHDVSDKASSCPNCGCPISTLIKLVDSEPVKTENTDSLSSQKSYAIKILGYKGDRTAAISAVRKETITKLGLADLVKNFEAQRAFIVCEYYDKKEAERVVSVLLSNHDIECEIVEKEIDKKITATAKAPVVDNPFQRESVPINKQNNNPQQSISQSNQSYNIPQDAPVSNPPKKSGGSSLVSIIIVLILIGLFAGYFKHPKKIGTDGTESGSGSIVVNEGESCSVGDLEMTFTKKVFNYEYKNDTYGFYKADQGKKFISATLNVKNTGKSDEYICVYDFDCYADNEIVEQKFFPDDDFINANLSPGREVTFTVYYEIPKMASSVEIEYDVNNFSNDKVTFYIK